MKWMQIECDCDVLKGLLKVLPNIFHLEVLTAAIMQRRLDVADNVTKVRIKNCSRKLKCQIKGRRRLLYFVQTDEDCLVSSSKNKLYQIVGKTRMDSFLYRISNNISVKTIIDETIWFYISYKNVLNILTYLSIYKNIIR